jgi:hypothetical protein
MKLYLDLIDARDGSVGIATRYRLDVLGIESRWEVKIFALYQTGPGGLPSLLYNGYRVFPGGKAVGAWRCPPNHI